MVKTAVDDDGFTFLKCRPDFRKDKLVSFYEVFYRYTVFFSLIEVVLLQY